ncbi:MAG: STAS domain-containing protein [Cellvibrio sp.]|jgi:phospholipid transport system transporter-binding protein|uniref:STAS domain-containing protein n=1 Tax=Cellvibrio sp. TaxID=1965322 RepID=UPI002716EF54|nr:STAS domain-containing protein [Cellvibrio sp.]
MATSASISIQGDTLTLSGVLDHESVLDIDQQGQQWLLESQTREYKLDLGAITYSSSAGIALLLGWLRIAQQQQKTLQFLHMPASMIALANVGGLEDLLV